MDDFPVMVDAHALLDFLVKHATCAIMDISVLAAKLAPPLRPEPYAVIKVSAMVIAHREAQENVSVFLESPEIHATSAFLGIMVLIVPRALVLTLIMVANPALAMVCALVPVNVSEMVEPAPVRRVGEVQIAEKRFPVLI